MARLTYLIALTLATFAIQTTAAPLDRRLPAAVDTLDCTTRAVAASPVVAANGVALVPRKNSAQTDLVKRQRGRRILDAIGAVADVAGIAGFIQGIFGGNARRSLPEDAIVKRQAGRGGRILNALGAIADVAGIAGLISGLFNSGNARRAIPAKDALVKRQAGRGGRILNALGAIADVAGIAGLISGLFGGANARRSISSRDLVTKSLDELTESLKL